MDKCAVGAFEKLIKKQTAGGGKARILPLRGKNGSYGKKNAAQALPIPRAGPSVSLPGRLQVYKKAAVIVTGIQNYICDYAATVEIKVAVSDFSGPQHVGRPGPQRNFRVRGEQLLKFV